MQMKVISKMPPSLLLRELVRNKVDLLRISDRLNINPSTVQKLIEGRPISEHTAKKVEAAIEGSDLFNEGWAAGEQKKTNHSTIERLMHVYRLYEEEKSIQRVGVKLGITRERVRQLLKKGAEIGLFKYRPRKPPYFSREKILKDFRRFLKLKQVASENRISMRYLYKLMELHRIKKSDLESIRLEGRRCRCMKDYWAVASRLGHHPTTTELIQADTNYSLEFKIRRSWGSLGAFRKELNVTPGMPVDYKPM